MPRVDERFTPSPCGPRRRDEDAALWPVAPTNPPLITLENLFDMALSSTFQSFEHRKGRAQRARSGSHRRAMLWRLT